MRGYAGWEVERIERTHALTWGVDEIDQKLGVSYTGGQFLFVAHLEIKGDGGGFDCDTALLLILSGGHVPHVTGYFLGNNTSSLDKRVGKCGLSVVDTKIVKDI